MKYVSKKKEFKFPKQVLNQVNECSNGGYVLFNFDSEGTPQVFSSVDDVSNAMALQLHISNWSKALEAYNLETAMEQFAETKKDDGEDEEHE
mgnify:CR=1 FL=1|jgi:hypothetical protein|tara:strand:+ start:147 stop:422 length:276 start_codon:yes stop_codon:yes gene_type:complete